LIGDAGQVGVVGPLDLATARLHDLLGDHAAARRHLAAALELARRSGSPSWTRRCEAGL
jgi:hypothetical protein